MSDPISAFVPLIERAVRSDGTIPIRIIGPGWGTSGYYSREVIERDVPSAFPPGTHMYWNHPTVSENMERPERDLRDLAAVTITAPRWESDGPAGPGMYAEARVFEGYAPVIDEIAEHVGVSIMAAGRREPGEADGRQGLIVTEISSQMPPGTPPRPSIDFVTIPGAGGKIVSIFESAPGAPPLPRPVQLSFDNLQEAQNLGEWIESRLHLSLTQIADDLFGNGHVNREERKALSAAIGRALDAYHSFLLENSPALFQRRSYSTAPDSADIAGLNGGEEISESAGQSATAKNGMEASMSEEKLKETADALAEARRHVAERDAAIAKMREQLLMREAKDHVSNKLAEAELPDVTKARLSRQLAANPPVKESGELDTAKLDTAIDTAIIEAQTELAAIIGTNGQVSGMGGQGTQSGAAQLPAIEESQKRTDAALARLSGLGGSNGH